MGCLKEVLKVSSGIVQWYRSSYGTDVKSSDIASPVRQQPKSGSSMATFPRVENRVLWPVCSGGLWRAANLECGIRRFALALLLLAPPSGLAVGLLRRSQK